MIRTATLFAIFVLVVPFCHAFSWDDYNVQRLFTNSEDIFAELSPGFPTEQQICLVEFKLFVDDLKFANQWAGKIMDSWGKKPTGWYAGNRFDFGHFDQCIGQVVLENQRTQYCKLQIEDESEQSFVMGVCVPSSCTAQNIIDILTKFMVNAEATVVSDQTLQCTTGDKPQFDTQQWVMVGLLILVAILFVSSTIYEVVKAYQSVEPSKILSSFSIFRNLEMLFKIRSEPAPLECLNGLRVLSMLWIILYYAFNEYRRTVAVYNPHYLEEFQKTAGRTYVSHGDLAADTFFLIGGVLMTYNVLKSLEINYTFNVLKFWLHRYLRLLALFGTVILLLTSFGRYIGNGPVYHQAVQDKLITNCEQYWWTSILFVQNYVNPLKLCIEPTWYISVDMQFYLIAPFIIFPLRRLGFRFIPVLCLLALASLSFIFGYSIAQRFHFNNTPDDYMKFIYYASHTRITQWLVGIILGFLLYKKETKVANIHKAVTFFLWFFTIAIMWILVFIPLPAYANGTEDVIAFAFYEALHRFVWSLCIAWIIYACFRGLGAPVNWFLSFPIFQPLAKLSYAVFILQYPIMVVTLSLQRTPEYFSEYMAFNLFINVLGMSLLFAIPLVLFIEMPILNVERGLYDAYNTVFEESYFERNTPQQRSIFKIPRLRVEKSTAF